MTNLGALEQFKEVGVTSQVDGASPHTLVAMLFSGLLDRLAQARGYMERGELGQQGQMISKSIAIVDSLRASLDRGQGGELGQRLFDLYDHMEMRLVQANSQSDTVAVEEVMGLVRELKSGWDEIAPGVGEHVG